MILDIFLLVAPYHGVVRLTLMEKLDSQMPSVSL